MSQLILFTALYVVGVVVAMAVGPWRRIWLCCAIGFAVGLACMVFLSIALLLLGAFHVAGVSTVYGLLIGTGTYIGIKRQHWSRRSLVRASAGGLLFTILCFPFCLYNFSSFSYDSHMFVMYGRVIGADGHLSLEMLERLNAWGVFQVVAHALRTCTKQDYLYGLAPAFAISMVATFGALIGEALAELRVSRRHRAIWITVAILVLLAIPMFRFHTIYIHSNIASGAYLLFFVAMFWLAETQKDTSYLPLAFLSLVAFTILRVEAVPFAMALLLVTVIGTSLPRREVARWYLPYTLVIAGWFALLAFTVPSDSVYLTPKKCLMFVAAIVMVFGYWTVEERWLFRRLTTYVPHLAVVACLLGIVAAYLTNEANMRQSALIWLGDLWRSPMWAWIWRVAAILAVVGLFVPAPPGRKPLVLGVWFFFGLVLIISSTGTAFGHTMDGSLIRMTLHILPLVLFYGVIKFAPLVSAPREP